MESKSATYNLGGWAGVGRVGVSGLGPKLYFAFLIEQNHTLSLHYISNEEQLLEAGEANTMDLQSFSRTHKRLTL